MYPDISQAIMKARVADRQHEAAVWRMAREARLAAPRDGTRRGITRWLGAGRTGGPRQAMGDTASCTPRGRGPLGHGHQRVGRRWHAGTREQLPD